MSDFPAVGSETLPLFLSSWSRWSAGMEDVTPSSTPTSGTWPTANRAYYIPFVLPWPYPVVRVWWYVGAANTTTNMDLGIYTVDGTRIYSTGSTAEGTVSTPQFVVPTTPLLLSPGRYYMALACSTVTANCGGNGTAPTVINMRLTGILMQDTALPLPATATFAASATTGWWPFFGITRTPTGF